MKSQALQELVKKIFSSEETKSQFMSDPDSVISRFDLTETEKRAVFATHAKLGLAAGNSNQLSAVVGPLSFWV
ncbi:MAG: hypothetical protein Q7J73_01500 [Dehalococcoidales bacterium]|nr:hypothetical protein [Dehalococcoidales bacterium]